MPTRSRAVPRLALTPLVAAAAWLAAAPAQAQDRPYYIGVSQAVTHETNIFRRGDNEASDTIYSTGVLGGLNLDLSRQHVYLNATANRNRYDKRDQLDNTSYSLTTGLDWETIGNLSGDLRYTARQNLTDYSVVGSPELKDIEEVRVASADVRYGMTSRLGLRAGVETRRVDFSQSDERDQEQDIASAGLRFGGRGVLALGVGVRVTKGETPRYRPIERIELPPPLEDIFVLGEIQPDELDRRDIDFTATWTPSGLSTVDLRLSATKQDHTAPSRSDFSGLTGGVTWDYRPTGKLALRSSLIRDTGTETSFISLLPDGVPDLQVDNNRLNLIASVAADYAVTAKIAMTGKLQAIRNTVQLANGAEFDRTTNRLRLGANYAPTRSITLACSLGHEWTDRYDATTTTCSAQFALR